VSGDTFEQAPFEPAFERYVDPEGRQFEYVRVRHEGSEGLGIHFSAFFGEWGDKKRTRENFKGYFHRLRMLGSSPDHDWLFVCDPFGALHNGTYYTGEKGDLFVERAIFAIIEREMADRDHGFDRVVTVGSSMGGTGALVAGLHFGVAGIVTVCPHIDLDICAAQCTKWAEVAFACPDGDPTSASNQFVTRRIRTLLGATSPQEPPPALFMQSVLDDYGVHAEQVLPLAHEWRQQGGRVELDVRPHGGHTSDFAPRALLLDAVDRLLAGDTIDTERYQTDPRFAGTPSPLTRTESFTLALRTKLQLRRKMNWAKAHLWPIRHRAGSG
jgi:pimeloyl-ACP methyl ester carboxylesterase